MQKPHVDVVLHLVFNSITYPASPGNRDLTPVAISSIANAISNKLITLVKIFIPVIPIIRLILSALLKIL